jgi:two-component system chemotaxis sensor kinase CheA
MHIIRNSVDHGAETREERAKTNKPKTVKLLLRAYHESGLVVIEIIDDGRGVNIEKVKAKAVKNGAITQAQADAMSEREAANLIFNPGLSTAEVVSNVSGRGVGMDVVKSNIEKIGGSVDLQSEFGKGTNLKIKIPLTLAIIPALIVTSAGERFAIPQMSLLELVRLDGDDVEKSLETVCGTPVYRLRGKLLPLVYLNDQLKLDYQDTDEDGNLKPVNIVVLQAEGVSFGLVVDEINDSEEIVVKPLSKQLKDLPCFAGATIMGDGKVALILDILGIAHMSKVLVNAAAEELLQANKETAGKNGNMETLLLFRVGTEGRMAIQLSKVSRIEEFMRRSIQTIRHQNVIQ